eukprot:g30376.t1
MIALLYSDDSYILELAKFGFAAITRIRQATQDLSELTPSSVPPHVTAMLGEVQELFELNSRSAALLNVPNLQSLCAFEGSSFDNTSIRFDPTPELLWMDTAGIEYYLAEKHPTRKLISGETIRFVPKCKRRRGQEQLSLAFQSSDGEVWECKTCDPPSYHGVNTEHKGKKHTCRSRVGGLRPHFYQSQVSLFPAGSAISQNDYSGIYRY